MTTENCLSHSFNIALKCRERYDRDVTDAVHSPSAGESPTPAEECKAATRNPSTVCEQPGAATTTGDSHEFSAGSRFIKLAVVLVGSDYTAVSKMSPLRPQVNDTCDFYPILIVIVAVIVDVVVLSFRCS